MDKIEENECIFINLFYSISNGLHKGTLQSITIAMYPNMTIDDFQNIFLTACSGNISSHMKCIGFALQINGQMDQIIPLSVACKAPEILNMPEGRVQVLFSSTMEINDNILSIQSRLEKIIRAFKVDEDLSEFECAILYEVCTESASDVLPVLLSRTYTIPQKKAYLYNLIHPQDTISTTNGMQHLQTMEYPTSQQIQNEKQGENDPNQLLDLLKQHHLLTALEYDILNDLLQQNDRQVIEILTTIPGTSTLLELRESLVTIVREITQDMHNATSENDETQELSMSNGVQRHILSPNWEHELSDMIQRWHTQSLLTEPQMNALYQLLAQNHHLLASAYEAYALDTDELELYDTLLRIAKFQSTVANTGKKIEETIGDDESIASGPHPEQEDLSSMMEAFINILEQECSELNAFEKQALIQLFTQKNELVLSAWMEYMETQDILQLSEILFRIARFTSQAQVKPQVVKLIGDLLHRHVLHSHEADGLLQLLEQKNEAMVGACEVYNHDGDIQELIETLLLIVKHANFGPVPKCTSPKAGASNSTGNAIPPTPPSSPDFNYYPQLDQWTPKNMHVLYQHGPASVQLQSLYTESQDSEQFKVAQTIDNLRANGQVANWHMHVLQHLLKNQDPRVFGAWDVYEEFNEGSKQLEFADTLHCLCDLEAWDILKESILNDWVQPMEEKSYIPKGTLSCLVEQEDDRMLAAYTVYLDDGAQEEFMDTLVQLAQLVHIEKHKVLEFISSLKNKFGPAFQLSPREHQQLLEAAMENDPTLAAAIEVFEVNHDTDDLKDTLRRIAVYRMLSRQ